VVYNFLINQLTSSSQAMVKKIKRKKRKGGNKRYGRDIAEITAASYAHLLKSGYMTEALNWLSSKALDNESFESLDEINAYLKKHFMGRRIDDIIAETDLDPVDEAQILAYEAMSSDDPVEAGLLVSRATELDPYCIDAMITKLMFIPFSDRERLEKLEELLDIATDQLGEDYFKEEKGHFWGVVTSRPYMRARAAVVDMLTDGGRKREAIEHCIDMLKLNPNDNQGMRDILLALLLEEDELEAAGKLLKKFSKDSLAVFTWGRVLHSFLSGNPKKAKTAYKKAHAKNQHMRDYFTGKKRLPTKSFDYYSPGSKEEAVICHSILKDAWQSHPEAIEWLKIIDQPQSKDGGPHQMEMKLKSQAKGKKPPSRDNRLYTLEVFIISGPVTEKFAKKNPVISRTIQIQGDQTLFQLHDAIFDAFNREDEHMYQFSFGKGPYDKNAKRYVLPMEFDSPFGDDPLIAGDVTKATIGSLGLKVKQTFGYWFDFGDDWWHRINVVSIKDKAPRGKYPKVTGRKGKSPPQYIDWDEEEE